MFYWHCMYVCIFLRHFLQLYGFKTNKFGWFKQCIRHPSWFHLRIQKYFPLCCLGPTTQIKHKLRFLFLTQHQNKYSGDILSTSHLVWYSGNWISYNKITPINLKTLYQVWLLLIIIIIPLPTVVAGGIIFYCWSFFLSFFFFRDRISEMALPTGNLLAHKVGYRCNFKNWVQNLGGDPPLKFGGP